MKKLTSLIGHPVRPEVVALALAWLALSPGTSSAQQYRETDLVSNTSQSGVTTVDPDLVNPWGISRSSTGPWWVSDQRKGVATLYNGAGAKQTLVVTIPQAGSAPTGSPTGIVFNGSTDFAVESGKPAVFIFAAFDGTISAWNPQANATVAIQKVQAKPGSVLTGATIVGQFGSGEILAFDAVTGGFQGKLEDANSNAITIPWTPGASIWRRQRQFWCT